MIRVNLAPATTRRRRPLLAVPRFSLGWAFLLLYLVTAAGAGAYWWTLTSEEDRLTAEIARISRELDVLRTVTRQAPDVKARLAELRQRIQVIETLTRNQDRPLRLLDAFADMVPPDLWVTGFEDRGPVLRVTGTAFSTVAVSDLMANLRRSGRFAEVDIVVARQDASRTPRLVTFEITCRFES